MTMHVIRNTATLPTTGHPVAALRAMVLPLCTIGGRPIVLQDWPPSALALIAFGRVEPYVGAPPLADCRVIGGEDAIVTLAAMVGAGADDGD